MKLTDLLESLNTILTYKLVENVPSRKQYAINCNDLLFMLVFDLYTPKHAVVSFYEQTETDNVEFGITNKFKYSGQLFSTIISIIRKELSHLDMIVYTASGTSRKSLYGALTKKYASEFIIYVIPTNTIEITIVSRFQLSSEQKQSILSTAEHLLMDK